MKRLILPILLAFVLCGCQADHADNTQPKELPTNPTYLYDPNSSIEDFTQGAVQVCNLADRNVTGVQHFAGQLLLLSTDDHVDLTTVLVLDREKMGLMNSIALDCQVSADALTVSADGKSLAYYYPQENAIVLLDSNFSELRRVPLPDQTTDSPVLSPDLTTAYYCAGSEIYAMDLENGLPRLLKQHNCMSQQLTALHFDGSILEVFLTRDDGKTEVAFISTQNGQTLGTDPDLLTLSSDTDHFLLQRLDGIVTETLIGQKGGQLKAFSFPADQTVWPAFPLKGTLVTEGSTVKLYNLTDGQLRSQVDLGKGVQILEVDADPAGNFVWLRAMDQQENIPVLLCWNVDETRTDDATVYLHDRYTADSPDAEGLARCQQLADSIGNPLKLTMLVGSTLPSTQNYSYVYEHQTQAFEYALTQLQQEMSTMPAEFFQKLGSVNQSGTVRIGLVRQILDISGKPASDMGGLHFVSSGDHYIILVADGNIRSAFRHQICHVLDSYVYGNHSAYDLWDQLNPEGFAYSGSYTVDTTLDDPRLQGEGQCFISSYGMTYAKEDRATIFAAAMEPNNKALFAAPGLQSKLQAMCSAIRAAYGWKETELTLPWEQHLKAE